MNLLWPEIWGTIKVVKGQGGKRKWGAKRGHRNFRGKELFCGTIVLPLPVGAPLVTCWLPKLSTAPKLTVGFLLLLTASNN